jgi:hypothetical protein
MELRFNPSSGMRSLKSAVKYVEDIDARASNMQPFFRGIESDVIQEMKHEFDASNPNKWMPISDAWKAVKASEGRPSNIGIYKGELLRAASDDAIKMYYPTGMVWRIAPVYSIGFTINRRVGISAREFLRGMGKRIVKTILARAL